MDDWKMEHICRCDVKDTGLLARFREKLKHWKNCLLDENDCHSVYNQLTELFWDHTVYSTFNEARRLSIETNDPSTGLQGTIIDLLDRTFMKSQATAIRRLTDKRKDVISLRRLIIEIQENRNLYSRENYVCYDGISFDDALGDDPDVLSMRNARQACYDYLSGKDRDHRSRDDKLSSTVFAAMKKGIEEDFAITKEVTIYVDNWVAHAATYVNRGKHTDILDQVSLRKLDECYRALIRIGKRVELLIDGFLLCSVPTPEFDQLENWDRPVLETKDLAAVKGYWDTRVSEIDNWASAATTN